MSKRTVILGIVIITLLSLAVSAWAYPRLPAAVPSHWNAHGEVNGYTTPLGAALLLPAIILGSGLLLVFLPGIDPLRKNYAAFQGVYYWFVLAFSLYMAYLHGLILFAGLGYPFNMNRMLLPAVGLFFILAGFLVERAKPNWFVGIRTPWTLSNPVVWEKTHRLGGLLFKISGAITLLGVLLPQLALGFILVTGVGSALAATVYSYFIYQEETRKADRQ
jgi:uncharacterized membrane protein